MHEEKAKSELHKNATSYSEQILEVTPHEKNICMATYFLSEEPSK